MEVGGLKALIATAAFVIDSAKESFFGHFGEGPNIGNGDGVS